MKFTVTIILTTIHFSLLGQPSWKKDFIEWDKEFIKENKLKEVLIYERIPKENPDYNKIPKGLRLSLEATFDIEGQLSRSNCKNCIITSDTTKGQCCADVIKTFFYDKNKLIRIEQIDFEKSTFLYYYDSLNLRRLIIEFNKYNNRNTLTLEHFDKNGNEINTIGIDFEHTSIYKTITTYVKLTKTIEEFGVDIWRDSYYTNKFEIFKNSNDFNEIENTFKSLNLDSLKPQDKQLTYFNDKKRVLKEVDQDDGSIRTFSYSKEGLIEKVETKMTKFTKIWEYSYRYWN
jgi:hypothetical protein